MRPQPGLPIFLVSAVCCLGLVVAASVFSANNQLGVVRANFDSVVKKVAKQAETDDDAHAALTKVEASDFGASANTLVASLQSCLGPTPVTAAKTALTQLAGFAKLRGAERVTLPPTAAAPDDADETTNVPQMNALLQADKVKTAQTLAVVQANLIAQDEVTQALYTVATTIGDGSNAPVTSAKYATGAAMRAYRESAKDVATAATALAPALKADRSVKFTAAQASMLNGVLTRYAASCQAVSTSSDERVPTSVVYEKGASPNFLDWHLASWPAGSFPNEMNASVMANGASVTACTSGELWAEGTAYGKLGSTTPVKVLGDIPGSYKILLHHTSATSEQWAVVVCA